MATIEARRAKAEAIRAELSRFPGLVGTDWYWDRLELACAIEDEIRCLAILSAGILAA